MSNPVSTLPNAGRAVVDIRKLRDYCLNPWHEDGKHKARVFASALGLGELDAEWLRDQLLDPARSQGECQHPIVKQVFATSPGAWIDGFPRCVQHMA